MPSAIISPTVIRGFMEENGFWNITWISLR